MDGLEWVDEKKICWWGGVIGLDTETRKRLREDEVQRKTVVENLRVAAWCVEEEMKGRKVVKWEGGKRQHNRGKDGI